MTTGSRPSRKAAGVFTPLILRAVHFQWFNYLFVSSSRDSQFIPCEVKKMPMDRIQSGEVKTASGLVNIMSKEELLRQKLEEERLRLSREMGIESHSHQHFKRPVENPFTKSQRANTTLLFGGLTWKHEQLVHGALEGLGYKCRALPVPNVAAFQTGKEYGNNGQCNPT